MANVWSSSCSLKLHGSAGSPPTRPAVLPLILYRPRYSPYSPAPQSLAAVDTGTSSRAPHSIQEPSYTAISFPVARYTPRASTQAVRPLPQLPTGTTCSRSTPAAEKACLMAAGGLYAAPSRMVGKGTLRAPGMCPPLSPARGSGSVPTKRPALLASTTTSPRDWEFASMSDSERTLLLSSLALYFAGGGGVARAAAVAAPRLASSTGRVSVVRPNPFQPGKPPSSTDTLSCPITLNVHHALGALKMPMRSYSTTVLSLLTPSTSMAAANAVSLGSMCGRPEEGSAMPSRSKNWLPGMRSALNSATALRPHAGMNQLASSTVMPGSAARSTSHCALTRGSCWEAMVVTARRLLAVIGDLCFSNNLNSLAPLQMQDL
mmetsp:Transcript_36831/g.81914  ORF Transcript_36831/g.81914 Transcript_36831/m.81914 type:complete len:376 (+) Transcript_36831:294-1421(+)